MNSQQYIQVMDKIKGRMKYVKSVNLWSESLGQISEFMVESICLQLRITIEDIAVACIIANSAEMPEIANRLKKEYRPRKILNTLSKMNPQCYPIPMLENIEGSHGNFKDTYDRPAGDWLTRDEAIKEYGILSNLIHQKLENYDGNAINIRATYEYTKDLSSKIYNLLSHHHITVLDENKIYRVLMSPSSDGKTQVAEFIRI